MTARPTEAQVLADIEGDILAECEAPTESQATPRLPWLTGSELAAMTPEAPDYVAAPYVARGIITQLSAKVKAGKTRLALEIVRGVLTGKGFLGHPSTYTAVAYLTEESPASFGPAVDLAGIAGRDDFHVLCRHFCGAAHWPPTVEAVRAYVREHDIGFVVVDTADVWMLEPGDDPNDSVVAEAAVRELQCLAGDGVAILLLRHERKSGGDISDSARGSSAFAGAVDALLSLQRMSGAETRRELECIARAALADAPAKIVIELEDGHYVSRGDAGDVAQADTRRKLLDVLPASRETAQALDELAEASGVGRTTLHHTLTRLVNDGTACREKGAGSAAARGFGYWMSETL